MRRVKTILEFGTGMDPRAAAYVQEIYGAGYRNTIFPHHELQVRELKASHDRLYEELVGTLADLERVTTRLGHLEQGREDPSDEWKLAVARLANAPAALTAASVEEEPGE
jgi:hypothetical protein